MIFQIYNYDIQYIIIKMKQYFTLTAETSGNIVQSLFKQCVNNAPKRVYVLKMLKELLNDVQTDINYRDYLLQRTLLSIKTVEFQELLQCDIEDNNGIPIERIGGKNRFWYDETKMITEKLKHVREVLNEIYGLFVLLDGKCNEKEKQEICIASKDLMFDLLVNIEGTDTLLYVKRKIESIFTTEN